MEIKREDAPAIPDDFPVPLWAGVILKASKLKIEDKIIIPDSVKSGKNEAWVMAVGHEVRGAIKPSQKVIFNPDGNSFIVHKGERYFCCHENDIYSEIILENNREELRPFNNQVLLVRGQEDFVISGVYLPDNQTLINYGTIIGVGENVLPAIKKGQKVMYNFNCNFTFDFRGKEVYSMRDFDILVNNLEGSYVGVEKVDRERRADIPLDKLPDKEPEKRVKGTKFHGLDNVGEN